MTNPRHLCYNSLEIDFLWADAVTVPLDGRLQKIIREYQEE